MGFDSIHTVRPIHYGKSALCSFWQNTGSSYTDVTNLSVTFKATGLNPVFICLVSDPDSTVSINGSSASSGRGDNVIFVIDSGSGLASDIEGKFKLLRGSTEIDNFPYGYSWTAATSTLPTKTIPACNFSSWDFPSAGTHTYKLQGAITGTTGGARSMQVQFVRLMVIEVGQ